MERPLGANDTTAGVHYLYIPMECPLGGGNDSTQLSTPPINSNGASHWGGAGAMTTQLVLHPLLAPGGLPIETHRKYSPGIGNFNPSF